MGPEWIVVLIIAVVVIFGASKLPDIARNLGRSSGEFKKGLREGTDLDDKASKPSDTPPPSES